MCWDFGIISGPVAAGAAGSAASGAAASGAAASAAAAGTAAATTAGLTTAQMIGLGLTALSTSLSAFGQYKAGQAQKGTYKYNAEMRRLQALDADRRGSIAEAQHRRRSQLIIGAQRAEQGGSGTVADEGSSADVLAETAEYGARDAAAARINAGRESWGYRAQADIDDYEGRMAGSTTPYRIGSTILTGASTAFKEAPWWRSWQASSRYPPP